VSAWYNEIDPYCAEWLRQLMKLRLIAEGEVDERSYGNAIVPQVAKTFIEAYIEANK
jgi:DNA (cytosine-5)-methyltransferase 1